MSPATTKAPGPTRSELKALARLRLREANALLDAGCYDGAAYLAGYVVELALKARICKLFGLKTYPEERLQQPLRTHHLGDLLTLAGLRNALDRSAQRSPGLQNSWDTLVKWGPEMRYSPAGTHSRQSALTWLRALDHPVDGVFTWIARYW